MLLDSYCVVSESCVPEHCYGGERRGGGVLGQFTCLETTGKRCCFVLALELNSRTTAFAFLHFVQSSNTAFTNGFRDVLFIGIITCVSIQRT